MVEKIPQAAANGNNYFLRYFLLLLKIALCDKKEEKLIKSYEFVLF